MGTHLFESPCTFFVRNILKMPAGANVSEYTQCLTVQKFRNDSFNTVGLSTRPALFELSDCAEY